MMGNLMLLGMDVDELAEGLQPLIKKESKEIDSVRERIRAKY